MFWVDRGCITNNVTSWTKCYHSQSIVIHLSILIQSLLCFFYRNVRQSNGIHRRRWISMIAYMSALVMAAAVVVVDIHDGCLTVESCLNDYPATVCCPDELPAHVGVRPRTFMIRMKSCRCVMLRITSLWIRLTILETYNYFLWTYTLSYLPHSQRTYTQNKVISHSF